MTARDEAIAEALLKPLLFRPLDYKVILVTKASTLPADGLDTIFALLEE